MKEGRRLRAGDRYTVPGGDGNIYRVLYVGRGSAVVRQENRERKAVTIGERTFTPETAGGFLSVSAYSSVRLIEEGPEEVTVAGEAEAAAPMAEVEEEEELAPVSLGPALKVVLE